ncbi:MAG: 3-deoxy-manno-octulosonate cytidylyltransferase [Cellvibrionales bacterium TMED148]|nr:3-deoxy-manno-octulosonate cytidylyltransferase [Porticoccaceae bacterium]RPG92402.1 MAG: 3-deoxy-manno-octulosonate cytidylyltransferase [Cellvibrionales bacterium TMED148]
MKFTIVIPARYQSERMPMKPLVDINGKTMLQRVWERALLSSAQEVIIATDHHDIQNVAKGFGAEVCMTKIDHESGTDRLQEVASIFGYDESRIIVNVQGDEPLIPPTVIEQVAEILLQNKAVNVATLSAPIDDPEELLNPNIVKIVKNKDQFALLFSRAPIPWPRSDFAKDKKTLTEPGLTSRHIGLYAYRVKTLNDFVKWPTSPIERLERLEQLRFLYHGVKIMVHEAKEFVPEGVDTATDLKRVREIFSKNDCHSVF